MPCNRLIAIHERRAELERLEHERKRLKTEADAFRLAKEIYEEIYDFLEKHGKKENEVEIREHVK